MLAGKLVVFLGFTAVLAFVVVLLATQNSIETRLDCDRAAGTCTIARRRMLGTVRFTVPIEGLRPASVRVSTGGRKGAVISLWLGTPKGTAYFDDYATRGGAQSDADRIDRFLAAPDDARLTIVRDHRAIYALAWVLSAVAASMVGLLGWVLFVRREPPAARV